LNRLSNPFSRFPLCSISCTILFQYRMVYFVFLFPTVRCCGISISSRLNEVFNVFSCTSLSYNSSIKIPLFYLLTLTNFSPYTRFHMCFSYYLCLLLVLLDI